MPINNTLFPMSEAYHELSTYRVMENPDLKCRIVLTSDSSGQIILVHIEPQEDVHPEYVREQAEAYADDVSEWFAIEFPTLDVYFNERDEDWFILAVCEK